MRIANIVSYDIPNSIVNVDVRRSQKNVIRDLKPQV